MRTGQDIELYLDTVVKERLHSNKGKLKFQMETLFEGIDFKNRRVLDIGGGCGLFSFYARCRGANHVLCLEPQADGSKLGVQENFRKLQTRLQASNVLLQPLTFQSFESDGEAYDIILLHNSINHLNETACMNLLKDDHSMGVYQAIFFKLSSLSKKGAKLIICDCSRHNFFAHLGTRNPFAPMIDWHKHQSPELWKQLLGHAGFINPKIRWSSCNRLRSFGRILLGNRLMAYFLSSHFCLTMEKG